MRRVALSLMGIGFLAAFAGIPLAGGTHAAPKSVYDFTVNDIDGHPVHLSQYKGDVLLVVNTASLCGFTPQYAGLEELYSKYKSRGFVVLGFPADNFKNQEPGTNQEIKTFCATRYHVDFPMFSKISVKGADESPLYQFLTGQSTDPRFAGDITWNFNKFLIDRNGRIVARFDSRDKPEDAKVIQAVEKALGYSDSVSRNVTH
jgi:glutathione peroxidase-family protein